jgi:CBS-domain-containing membrane protein
MHVEDIMTRALFACDTCADLETVARVMWEHDCGCVPIVNRRQVLMGIVTDRDVAMAAYLQGKRLADIAVKDVMSHCVQACEVGVSIELAHHIMRNSVKRRLPVVDRRGKLVGLVAWPDLLAAAQRQPVVSAEEAMTGEVLETVDLTSRHHRLNESKEDEMKRVAEVMSTEVASCHMNDSMNHAAQLMWEHDCGCIPIVDDDRHVVGIITDRDICMAAYTQGKSLNELPVSLACSRDVQTCRTTDTVARAEELMTNAQVRRLPVVDPTGVLVGLVSMSDLAHHTKSAADKLAQRTLAAVLEAVTRRRHAREPSDNKPGVHTTLANHFAQGQAR